MGDAPDRTTEIQLRLDRLRAGDGAARDELMRIAGDRLDRLARKMLKGYPGVRRWEQTDDVSQNASLRLYRALEGQAPESARSFINLAAIQIRRELIDMARRYFGPRGLGARHASQGDAACDNREVPASGAAADTHDPTRLVAWTEFHGQVDALPDEEKEVFNLLWYQGLTQAEAAGLLGVTERVVKYRWRSARLKLHDRLDGQIPE